MGERVAMLKGLPPPGTTWLYIEVLFDSLLEATDMPEPVQEARRLYHLRVQARRTAKQPEQLIKAFVAAFAEATIHLGRDKED